MKQMKKIAGILAITGLLTFNNATVYAQNPEGTTTTRADNDHDGDRDYGWIGLLGLAGLAGLLKRNDKHVHHTETGRTTTGPSANR